MVFCLVDCCFCLVESFFDSVATVFGFGVPNLFLSVWYFNLRLSKRLERKKFGIWTQELKKGGHLVFLVEWKNKIGSVDST